MNRNTTTPMLRKLLSLALAFVLAVGLLGPSIGFGALAADESTEINLFSFNDFHGTVDNSASTSNPGMARFAAVAKKIMGDYPNAMLLAAGDTYQGSAISNYFVGEPVSEMMKYLGVKYSALGNHDFDWGQDKFAKFSADAGGLQFLAANIFLKGTNDQPDYCKPYATVEIDGKKIGLVGWAHTGTPSLVTAKHIADIEFRANSGSWFVDAVKEWKAQEGWDAVIALTHGSLSGSNLVGVIDGIITGHSHSLSTSATNGIPTVQASYNGRALGRLRLVFDNVADTLTVTSSTFSNFTNASQLPVGTVDETMQAAYKKFFDIADPIFSRKVGEFGAYIDNSSQMGAWASQIVYDFIKRETGDADYVLVQNAGGWRSVGYGRTPDEKVDYWFLNTLMPFDNEIYLFQLKGEYLINILNGRRVNGSGSLGSSPVIVNAHKVGNDWYLTSTGEKIDPEKLYKTSFNDFMFTGGDNYGVVEGSNSSPALTQDYAVYDYETLILGVPLREALAKELTVRWLSSHVLGDIRTSASSNIEGPVDYTISLEGMKNVLSARIYFEVDGSKLDGKGLKVLADGFGVLDVTTEKTGAIHWTELENGVWQGEIMLAYFGRDGFTSDAAVDIAKVIYGAKQYGDATMKLTKLVVTGINEDGVVVYLNSEIRTAEATTSVIKVYSPYDLNRDGRIDDLDLGVALRYYQAVVGDADWNAAKVCDFDGDGDVDLIDILDLFRQYAGR